MESAVMVSSEIAQHEQVPAAEVCLASAEAARQIVQPILKDLANPTSVLYMVMNARNAGLPPEARFGIAPALLVDPSKSGVVVARYLLQGGELPSDTGVDDPNSLVTLWSAQKSGIPKLRVPEGSEVDIMTLSDKSQMRGGGPIIFSREELAQVPHLPRTILNVVGGANNAVRERVKTAVAYLEVHGNPEGQVILGTADPTRILKEAERKATALFAPEAMNELELFIDSAIEQGFEASDSNRYGVRFLPDGSSYTMLQHPSGARMVLLAPALHQKGNGNPQSGVYNAYFALDKIGTQILGDDFQLEGSNVLHVSGTHYGAMAVMNNLNATYDLRASLGSFRVIGDNQPKTRGAQAHLTEIGLTFDAAGTAIEQSVALRNALLQEAA